ncbi:MAG: ATP-dependent metallopeptidase FtsH/Yme1/Tma family protein, partial [Sphingorhabdus sp.]|uniref:ATP-dependent metallopeptidase FtsH/Yme1/Tma family protein n=1 Tax=Sphingorhabdus sp. TaxID=1902408 RepID=UPI003C992AB6
MNDEQEPKGNPLARNLMIWAGIMVALLLVVSIFSGGNDAASTGISYSNFRDKIEAGEVKSVAISPNRITGELSNGEQIVTVPIQGDTDLYKLLDEKGVDVQGKPEEQPSLWLI